MIHPQDLRVLVIAPALHAIGLWSPAAENLLVGTAMVEGVVGNTTHLRQIKGPALGIFQMEPATHDDCWRNFLRFRPELAMRCNALAAPGDYEGDTDADFDWPAATALIANLKYAAAMARIRYYRAKPPLPDADDIPALAMYWRLHYNTLLGKGDPAEFVRRYPG